MSSVKRPEKLLVIRLGAMGDLIHLSPSFRHIKQAFPGLALHVLTSPAYLPLVAAFDGVDEVIAVDKARWLQQAAALSGQNFTAVANLHPSVKTRLLSWGLGLRGARVGTYRKEKLPVAGQAQRAMPRRHAVQDFYRVFALLLDMPPWQDVSLQALTPQLSVKGVSAPALPPNTLGLVLGVGGKRANRAWPLEHFVTLAKLWLSQGEGCQGEGYHVALIGGQEDEVLAKKLAETLLLEGFSADCVVDYCGALSMLQTAVLLQHCVAVVGGDTGPMHVAGAVGAPTVSVFGPTSTARTGVLSAAASAVVQPPQSLVCWPCEQPTCALSPVDQLACMKACAPSVAFEQIQLIK